MRIPLPLRVISNSVAYYLLKYGLIEKADLYFKTKPDRLNFELSKDMLRSQWDHVKQLLKLIAASEFEYVAGRNEMVVVSGKGERRTEAFDFSCIASLRYAMDNNIVLEKAEDGKFFIAKIAKGDYQFFVRKANPSDLLTIKALCEEEEYRFLFPFLPGKVVVDVGANIGDTAILFAKKGAVSIEAYEIHPVLYDIARRNIQLNRLEDKAKLYDCGIGNTAGEMRMRDDNALGPTAAFGLKESKLGRDVAVRLVSMKSVIDRLGEIDVLKMDCEGAEFEIFNGLNNDDLRKIHVIGMEYHKEPQPLITKLEAAGFKVSIIFRHSPVLGIMLAVRS